MLGLIVVLLIRENYPWSSSNPTLTFSSSYPEVLVEEDELPEYAPSRIFSSSYPEVLPNSRTEQAVENGEYINISEITQ